MHFCIYPVSLLRLPCQHRWERARGGRRDWDGLGVRPRDDQNLHWEIHSMQTMLMAVAAMTAIGVDVGWQPTANGELEYIIQIEPHQLKNLKPGDVIEVGVRPQLRHVRRYKIVVGEGELPRNAGGTDLVPEQPAAVTKSLKSGSQDPSPGLPLDTNPERSVVVDNNARGGPPKASAEPATDNGETAVSPAEKTAPELYVIPNLSEELRNKDLLVPPPYPDHFNSTNAETESRAVAQPLPAASHVPVPRATPRTTDLETLPPAGFGPSREDSATISGGMGDRCHARRRARISPVVRGGGEAGGFVTSEKERLKRFVVAEQNRQSP